jgi:hypothetical protein
MTISTGLRTFDMSESNIVENFGQCGSSALPPYHGVTVRLCCQSIVRAFSAECPENPRAFVRHRHAGDVGPCRPLMACTHRLRASFL